MPKNGQPQLVLVQNLLHLFSLINLLKNLYVKLERNETKSTKRSEEMKNYAPLNKTLKLMI